MDTTPPVELPSVPGYPAKERFKTCRGPCGRTLEATEQYFQKYSRSDDGLRHVCKECRRHEKQLAKNRKVSQKVKDIDKLIQKHVERAAIGGSNVPHSAELFENLTTLFGGSRGFSISWMQQYLASDPGSQQRERMLAAYLKLGQHVTDTGVAKVPVDMLTDEDLERELQERLDRRMQAGIVEGQVVQRDEFRPEDDEYEDEDEDTEVDDEDDDLD